MKKRIILGIIVLIATFNTFSEELSSEELFNTGLKIIKKLKNIIKNHF